MMGYEDILKWSGALGVATVMVVAAPAKADPRAVVELFTSQGCSSCPPADKILGELAKDPSIVALSMPIDYWDYLGWKDTLADSRFSARQKAYSHVRGDRDVYTPQVIVNGETHVIGSDRAGIENAIHATRKSGDVMSVPMSMTVSGKQLNVSVAGPRANHTASHGEVWICALSKAVPIAIGRGENRGREIVYHNVVRNWLKVGDWTGVPGNWSVPMENIARDGVDAAVVYLQDGTRDRPGPMLGAAYTSLH
ncbi:MAG TPA: DUF1223 domain-containing protein [Xanthobacteraceae bacterium]|jgi:hypothetical protein